MQYAVVYAGLLILDEIGDALNKLAQSGFRIISVVTVSSVVVYTLAREVD